MSGLSTANETSTPSAPPSGSRRLYPTALGWVDMDSAGNTYLLGAMSVSGGVTGRVVFGGSGTAFAADASLFWDNTNKWLGIGTGMTTPVAVLETVVDAGATPTYAGPVFSRYITSANAAQVVIRRARNTRASPQALSSGDAISNINTYGHDGSNFVTAAQIAVRTTQNWVASTTLGSQIEFYTNANGAAGAALALTIGQDKGLSVVGGLNVGSATGATNPGMIYATASYVASAQVYYLSNTATNTAASAIFPSNLQAEFDVTNSAGATYGSEFLGFNLFLKYRGAATINAVNLRDVVGITANVFDYNSGTIPYMVGVSADMRLLTGAGTVTNLVQFHARSVIVSAGSVTNKYSFKAESGAGAASIYDGINVGTATGAGTAEINVESAAGANPTIRLLDGDVNQPFSAFATTFLGGLTVWSSTAGGLNIQGVSDSDATGFGYVARVGATTTTVPAMVHRAGKHNGSAGTANLADAEMHSRWEKFDGTALVTLYGNGNINTAGVYQKGGTQVVGARVTGWGTPTGTLYRTALTNASTQAQFNQAIMAVVTDLIAHGLIGA